MKTYHSHGGMTGRCYETHPALDVAGFKIYGGSCRQPIVKDADIYIGLDYGMATHPSQWPWEPGESFLYPINDMHAPSDPVSFKKLIDWMQVQLIANNKKIHIGCIGGHGRTGTVLSALVAAVTNDKDAIAYVRENYCVKAVESHDQVEFLHKHFGCNKVPGYKEGGRHMQDLLGTGKPPTPGHWSAQSSITTPINKPAHPSDDFYGRTGQAPAPAKSFVKPPAPPAPERWSCTPTQSTSSLWGKTVPVFKAV